MADLLRGSLGENLMNIGSSNPPPTTPVAATKPSTLSNIGAGVSMINPIIGAGLGVAGFMQDKAANEKAERAMEAELNTLKALRGEARQRYIAELDSDAARRQMLLRGQTANTPAYQALMSNLANQNKAATAIATDNMEKTGTGDNSGMSAAIASNNMSNIG